MATILKPPYQYVIDSSALFDLKNQYPERIFGGLWERFNEMVEQRLIIAPREVLREVRKGNDVLIPWSETYERNFLEPCDDELLLVQSILSHYPPEVLAKYSTKPWADPFVIACAKYYKLPIIQHETNDPNQHKIPPIAKKYNVQCIKLVQFFDEEHWYFVNP
jgi:hypothetical protein